MVEKLRASKFGVRYIEEKVPALLVADDIVILTEGEEKLRRRLGVLEWAMKVNADKCGVKHMVHVRERAIYARQ